MSKSFAKHSSSRKKVVSLLALMGVLSVSISVLFAAPANAYSGSGAGTSGDPYMITSCAQFQEIESGLSATYELANSINCVADANASMIGSPGVPFTGTFDGAGFSISVDIDIAPLDQAGLFSNLASGAVVKNLTLEGDVAGGWNSGGLVGFAVDSTIQNVIVNANVNGG